MPASVNACLVGAALGVGLDGRPDLLETTTTVRSSRSRQGGAHLVGVGGVQHRQLHPGGGADDLGGQRRAAHPAEHDVVEPRSAQVLAQRRDLADERPRGPGQADPGQPDRPPRPRRPDPTAWRPGRRACWRSGRRPGVGTCWRDRVGRRRRRRRPPRATCVTCPPRLRRRRSRPWSSSLLDVVEQLVPGLLELVDALALEHVRSTSS